MCIKINPIFFECVAQLENALINKTYFHFYFTSLLFGGNEPTTTNAPIQDEVVRTIQGMNQKCILFPCPRIFQPFSLPQIFPLLPTYPTSISHFFPSLHLKKAPKLEQHKASTIHETQGLKKVESSTLKEHKKEKARKTFHPKCRSERKKVTSFPSLHFFSSMSFFLFFYLK